MLAVVQPREDCPPGYSSTTIVQNCPHLNCGGFGNGGGNWGLTGVYGSGDGFSPSGSSGWGIGGGGSGNGGSGNSGGGFNGSNTENPDNWWEEAVFCVPDALSQGMGPTDDLSDISSHLDLGMRQHFQRLLQIHSFIGLQDCTLSNFLWENPTFAAELANTLANVQFDEGTAALLNAIIEHAAAGNDAEGLLPFLGNESVQALDLSLDNILTILEDCNQPTWTDACIDDHPVVEFLLEHQGSVQFGEEEINRFLENPELFQEVSTFLSQHLIAGGSESDKNLAVAIARAYDDIYAEFGSTTLELGDGPSDPIRDIVIDMLLETVKELVADFVPGGTLATIGPELFNNLQGGQWMDAMYNAVDIVLNEADTFFPAAKMGSFAYGLFVKGKHLKKAFEAFKKAKSLGEDFLLKLYDVFRNKLNWSISKVRDNFQFLGGVNAKVDGASGSDFFEKMKEAFGVSVSPFPGVNGQPIFKILELPYEPNQALYMELYPEANSGWNWTIEISKGPKNAVTYTQLVSKFKIRFDF